MKVSRLHLAQIFERAVAKFSKLTEPRPVRGSHPVVAVKP